MKAANLYKNKKVLVLGLGLNQGGLGVSKFFAKAGAQVRVTDLKSKKELKASLDELKSFKNIKYTLGEHKFEDIDWAELIIKNPAIKPGNKYLEYAQSKNKQIEMDMGIFLQFASPDQVLGVTGTKGKSTTSSLIYHALKEKFGKRVIFAGNIGKSVMDTIPHIKEDSIIVLELSSFQLEAWEKHQVSPHIAVITNILEDHLNYYGTMQKYILAKRVIAKYQQDKDYLFINADNKVINKDSFLKGVESKITRFSPTDLPKNFVPTLPGEHNRYNYAAALSVTKVMGILQKDALISFNKFKGVEFRLQLVKNYKGVKIYNDTAATGPDAATEALKALPNSIVICGGMNKNLNYKTYSKALSDIAKMVYFIEGDATEEIKKYLTKKGKQKVMGEFNNFDKMLKEIKKVAQAGDTVILSPAAASFNLFQNEFDRGRKFNSAVEKFFK